MSKDDYEQHRLSPLGSEDSRVIDLFEDGTAHIYSDIKGSVDNIEQVSLLAPEMRRLAEVLNKKSGDDESVQALLQINGFYQDIEAILGDYVGFELIDGTTVPPGGFSDEEKLRRVRQVNLRTGAITARWV